MGIVGYGGMGSYHANVLLKPVQDIIHLKGAFDIAPERRAVIRQDGLLAYASLDSLLGDPEVDLVLIATPNHLHKQLAIQTLEAGKHVLCEKPAMLSSADLTEVLNVAKRHHKEFFVHQNRRWDPDFRQVSELLTGHEIGDVFRIESRVHGANGIPGDWRHYRRYGGGMVLDWGVHLLDQLLYLIPGQLTRVYAETSQILGNDCDDGFTATLTWAQGVTAVVEVGTTNFIKLPRWYVQGTKGTASIADWNDPGRMTVATGIDTTAPAPIQAGVGLTKTMAPPTESAVRNSKLPNSIPLEPSFYENVYQVLTVGATKMVTNESVLRVLQLIETIFDSATQHQVVTFDK